MIDMETKVDKFEFLLRKIIREELELYFISKNFTVQNVEKTPSAKKTDRVSSPSIQQTRENIEEKFKNNSYKEFFEDVTPFSPSNQGAGRALDFAVGLDNRPVNMSNPNVKKTLDILSKYLDDN